MSTYFISGDWGTSNLRLRLVDKENCTILSSIETDTGIANTFAQWKLSGEERILFYQSILLSAIHQLEKNVSFSLKGTSVVVSGMLSSTMGMIELPYAPLPIKVDGEGLIVHSLPITDEFTYPLQIISGVRTGNDLMRGEEVQVIGACQLSGKVDGLVILPGTHCKHVWVKDKHLIDCKTYMTGELFALLANDSILAASIDTTASTEDVGWEVCFQEGIEKMISSTLLAELFGIRAGHLLQQRTAQQNKHYLNGLLLGSELKNFPRESNESILLVGNRQQLCYYQSAFGLLGVSGELQCISTEEATVQGHCQLLQN